MAKAVTEPYVEFAGTAREYTVRPLRDDEKQARYSQYNGRVTKDETRPLVVRRCSQTKHMGRASHACGDAAVAAIDHRGHTAFYCARHLAGHKRSVSHSARLDAEIAARRAREQEADETAETLGRRAGFLVTPASRGRVLVSPDDLDRLLKEAGR